MIPLIANYDPQTFWQDVLGVNASTFLGLFTGVNSQHPLPQLIATISLWLLVPLSIVLIWNCFKIYIETMRTGKLGGDFFNVWSGVKLIVALVGIAPIFGGYNGFAMVPISVAYGANALADQLYPIALNSMASAQRRPSEAFENQTMKDAGEQVINAFYQQARCSRNIMQLTAENQRPVRMGVTATPVDRIITDPITGERFLHIVVGAQSTNTALGKNNCGEVSIRLPKPLNASTVMERAVTAKAAGMRAAMIAAQGAVQRAVNENLSGNDLRDALLAARRDYNEREQAVKISINLIVNDIINNSNAAIIAGQESWMMLGTYYWKRGKIDQIAGSIGAMQVKTGAPRSGQFSAAQQAQIDAELHNPAVAHEGDTAWDTLGRWMGSVAAGVQDAKEFANDSAIQLALMSASPLGYVLAMWGDEVLPLLWGDSTQFMRLYLDAGGGDPIRALQKLGDAAMLAAEAGFVVIALVQTAASVVDATGEGMKVIMLPFLIAIAGMFVAGIALMFYLPLLPMILFVLGVISWVFDIIEGVVASAFIALSSMMSINGQASSLGDMAQGAKAAWIGVFARPPLMIAFFVMAHYMMDWGAQLGMQSFIATQDGIFDGFFVTGLPTAIIMFFLFVAFVVTIARRIFSTILIGPEAVVQYFGARFTGRNDEALANSIEGTGGAQGGIQAFVTKFSSRVTNNQARGNNANRPLPNRNP